MMPGCLLAEPWSVLPQVGQKPVVNVFPLSVGRVCSRASPWTTTVSAGKYANAPNGEPLRFAIDAVTHATSAERHRRSSRQPPACTGLHSSSVLGANELPDGFAGPLPSAA